MDQLGESVVRKCQQGDQYLELSYLLTSLMLPHFISSFHVTSLLSAQAAPRIITQGK